MNIEQTWSVSSDDIIPPENKDLSELVGLWSSQLQVSISNPTRINFEFADIRVTSGDDINVFPSESAVL